MTDNSITVQGVNDFLTDVNALRAHGGGDCPEYGMTAILQAIELIDGIDRENVQNKGKHNLIVLTDASAKDESLYQQVIANATAQDKLDVTVHFFYSGSGCGAEGFGIMKILEMIPVDSVWNKIMPPTLNSLQNSLLIPMIQVVVVK